VETVRTCTYGPNNSMAWQAWYFKSASSCVDAKSTGLEGTKFPDTSRDRIKSSDGTAIPEAVRRLPWEMSEVEDGSCLDFYCKFPHSRGVLQIRSPGNNTLGNGRQFMSKIFDEAIKSFGITHLKI